MRKKGRKPNSIILRAKTLLRVILELEKVAAVCEGCVYGAAAAHTARLVRRGEVFPMPELRVSGIYRGR